MKIITPILLSLIILASSSIAAEKNNVTAGSLLDDLRKDLQSLSADFEQSDIDVNGRLSDKSSGKVWLQAPKQFKWQYLKPAPQLITANGKQVWIYDQDLEQVTIKNQDSKQNPIYVLLDKQKTEENYTLALKPQVKNAKDKLQWVEMLPKIPSEEVKVVWLGIEDNNLKVLKLQNQLDNIVIFEFLNIKRNPKLEAEFFTFIVPKGTDVIRDSVDIGEF
ncbi:MAG TPA: outer membrane lipoprotein chaperone LolA [Oceanospirillales bacterium]|nr:outer membrane lipoprotein chaperone LolA [Oceanospirillales bacterium]